MLTQQGFIADGTTYPEWRHTSDGFIAVFNSVLKVWQYFRLNWATERYDLIGSTDAYDDPNQDAFDKSETWPIKVRS